MLRGLHGVLSGTTVIVLKIEKIINYGYRFCDMNRQLWTTGFLDLHQLRWEICRQSVT